MKQTNDNIIKNVLDQNSVNNKIQIKDYSEKKCCDKETRNILIVPNGYHET